MNYLTFVTRHGRRWRCVTLLAGPLCALLVSAAVAKPRFVFPGGTHQPADFHARFDSCISHFERAGGLARRILSRLNGAEITLAYSSTGSDTGNPAPGGNSKGQPLTIDWASGDHGLYGDKAPRTPCGELLHELEHAARYFSGRECTGLAAENEPAYDYDENLGVRAENWWLRHLGKRQRTRYDKRRLPRWTRWPAHGGRRVPRAPRCVKPAPLPSIVLAVQVADCGGGSNGPRTSTVTASPAGKLSVDQTGDTDYQWSYAHAPATITLTGHPGPGCGPPRWQYTSGSLWATGTCRDSSYVLSCTVVANPLDCPCFGNASVDLYAIFPTSTLAAPDRRVDSARRSAN